MCFTQEARKIESVEMLRDSMKRLDDVRDKLIDRLISSKFPHVKIEEEA